MDKSEFYSRYADYILSSAIKLEKNDCLSINTEENDYEFARLIAQKAKLITGNGSYIQKVKNGRIIEEFDILSSFPLNKKPTVFIYLSYIKEHGKVESGVIYEARELQRFSLLGDPIDNPLPSLAFVTVPLPSPLLDSKTKENDYSESSLSLLSSILRLEDERREEEREIMNENLIYLVKALNEMKLVDASIYSDEGTDLTFSFLPSSSFHSSINVTTSNRMFSPYILSNDIFRLISPYSLTGWLNITKPILLWGERINNLSLLFERGLVKEVSANRIVEELFRLYLEQDEHSARASMLTLSDLFNPLSEKELTYIPQFDRMRTPSITLGSPRGEAVESINISETISPLTTLTLPIGSKSLVVNAIDKDGNERTIYSYGRINED